MPLAEVYPESLTRAQRDDWQRDAETGLYDAFCDQLGRGWMVLYHVAWLGQTKASEGPRDGETDFIVSHPELGSLVLEVKGGGIRYEGSTQQWSSRDRTGAEHNITNPFEQVRACKHALRDKIKALPGWTRRWAPLGHAVAFPNCVADKAWITADAPRDIIIDSRDMDDLGKRLKEILRYWFKESALDYPKALQDTLREYFAQRIELANPLSLQIRDDEREIIRLTEDQLDALRMLGSVRRAGISGCAGSGKTMLAVQKATSLVREGFATALLCFNKPLAAHLRETTSDLPGLHVSTFHQFCEDIGRAADLPIPEITKETAGTIFANDYPELLTQAAGLRPDLRFDAIIVDEAQDFEELWWVALEDMMAQGRESVLYVFYDDNQRLYREKTHIPDDLVPIRLTKNVRNTQLIFHCVMQHYEGNERPEACGPRGRKPEVVTYEHVDGMLRALSKKLNQLVVNQGVLPGDIVVLTAKGLERTALHSVELPGPVQLAKEPAEDSGVVPWETVFRFKGLESPVVLIAELDDELSWKHKNREHVCYVAFSRAKEHLVLLGTEAAIATIGVDIG